MNLPFSTDLKGKVAVITGAGGVLCSMFAQALAQCGAKVAVLDLDLSAAQSTAQEITLLGGTALALECNVLDKTKVEQCHDIIHKELGPCDILLNGAGGNHPKATTEKEYYEAGDLEKDIVTFFDLDTQGIEFVFNLNFLGTLIPTQVFAKDMVGGEHPTIINISSMNAFTPLTKIPAYSGAKAAISNFTQWLAVHFSKTEIRVNAIAPGFFVTGQNQNLLFDQEGQPRPRAEKILASTPMGRFGKEEELLGTLLWLVNYKASSFVTGIVVPVDGGFSAYSGV